ncbi:MAG TPA: dihydrofolate reductase family protein [Mycobacteriales bacterium]|nr:dihydrofolate reductase family protein [Mycobacteriales bacterium]
MRKLRYVVATTLDGFICRQDGSSDDFPTAGDHVQSYRDSLASYDAVLMGRVTYEVGLKVGVTSPYPMMKQYVVARSLRQTPDPDVELVADPERLVRDLKSEPGKDIYLCGGAKLATAMVNEGLVDEIVLKLNPLVFGVGIPFLHPTVRPLRLSLTDLRRFDSGVVFLTYAVC